MKLDISKFKKLKTEKDHTVLQHPDGHSIKVMHSPLSPDVKKQLDELPMHDGGKIVGEDQALKSDQRTPQFDKARSRGVGILKEQMKHMADGGSVVDPSKLAQAQDAFRKSTHGYADGGEATPIKKENYGENLSDVSQSTESKAGDKPDAVKKFVSNFADGGPAQSSGQQMQDAFRGATHYSKGGPTPGQFHFHFYAQGSDAPVSSADQGPADAFQQGLQSNQPQGDNVSDNQAPMQDASATPETPMAPAAVDHNAPPTGTLPEQALANTEREAGATQAMGQATGAEQAKEAGAQEQFSGEMGDLAKAAQNARVDIHNKFDTVSDQVAAGHIDPTRWWISKSVPSKIATAIGMMFAGAGAGISGHPEMASQAIDHAVEMDIDSQKADLQNKNTLLSKYMEMYNSLPAAEAATRLTLAAGLEGQIKSYAAKLGSQNAAQQAQVAVSQIRNKVVGQIPELAKGQVMAQMYNQMGQPQAPTTDEEQAYQKRMADMRVLKPDLGKDMQDKYLPGVGVARKPVPEKVNDELIARKDLSDKLAQLENFSRQHSGTTMMQDPAVVNQGTALARNVQDAYRRANAQGVFREAEKDFVEKSIKTDPTAFFSKYRAIPGYQTTRRLNDNTIQQFYKGYGIKPFENSGMSEAGGQTAMKDGVKYVKVPGGWKKAQ